MHSTLELVRLEAKRRCGSNGFGPRRSQRPESKSKAGSVEFKERLFWRLWEKNNGDLAAVQLAQHVVISHMCAH